LAPPQRERRHRVAPCPGRPQDRAGAGDRQVGRPAARDTQAREPAAVPSDTTVTIEGVRKRYGDRDVLDVASLAVESHSSLVRIAPGGCGKSTLLRIVVGLVDADAGRVVVAGVPMERATHRALRLRMGYVIQEGGLFPHLSAAQNVAIVARDLGWD